MGIKLREAGIDSFVILERADRIGGTWRDNDYPGCACDIPSHLYSFSFEPKPDWSRMFPPQPEIWDYLEFCVDKYSLRDHLRTGQNVAEARFDDASGSWTVCCEDGAEFHAAALVSGMGGLSRPALPSIPGIDTFNGESFHSANWNHDLSLAGKKVAVIGTGASAIQFVPQIVGEVGRLFLFQRTPPWIVPKLDRPIRRWEKWLFQHVPACRYLFRSFLYWRQEIRGIGFTIDTRLMGRAKKIALEHMHASIGDQALRKKVTPDYTIGCKRILISNDYYPALQDANLKLVTEAIERVTETGVVTVSGQNYEVDVLIYGTGFNAVDPLTPTRIFGRGGRELGADWSTGPEAYLGITVSGYPNLFLLMGPNTGLGHNSIIFMIESQVRYAVQMIRRILEGDRSVIEVRSSTQAAFNDKIQTDLAKTVWSSGCRSWYQTADGRHPVLWPGFTFTYWLRTLRPDLEGFDVTPAADVTPDKEPSTPPR